MTRTLDQAMQTEAGMDHGSAIVTGFDDLTRRYTEQRWSPFTIDLSQDEKHWDRSSPTRRARFARRP